jgi:hypothetical protein
VQGACGAAADPDAAELLALARNQRHTGQSRIARQLAERGALAEGITEAEAADVVYALFSPELYRIFIVERGWRPERFGEWLSKALRDALLPLPSVPRPCCADRRRYRGRLRTAHARLAS